ncbi:MAG: hypothetical protein ACFCUS_14220 [Rubrimonas sp.]
MTAATEHRLDGLEPDNLLAFLALLGLMRALEAARPDWRPRVGWTVDDPPVRPFLKISHPATRVEIAAFAAQGTRLQSGAYSFDRDRFNFSREEARSMMLEAAHSLERLRADLLAALMSDSVPYDEKTPDGRVAATPLKLLDVAQTAFLKTLSSLANRFNAIGETAAADAYRPLERAVFENWTRTDREGGLRFDHADDRRHAYRWKEPTADPTVCEAGANILAVLGLVALTAAPALAGGHIQLRQVGVRRPPGSAVSLRWPIWRHAMSLAAVRAVLDHPALQDPAAQAELGIVELRETRRVQAGKYMNFTRAELI